MHQHYLQLALEQAYIARSQHEVPIGAVLCTQDQVFYDYNRTIQNHDPTAHAEVNVIRQACIATQNHRLKQATLYITLEPCIMCYGTIVQARISHIVFGAYDPKAGVFSKANLSSLTLNHHPTHTGGILEKDCKALLQTFFQSKR